VEFQLLREICWVAGSEPRGFCCHLGDCRVDPKSSRAGTPNATNACDQIEASAPRDCYSPPARLPVPVGGRDVGSLWREVCFIRF
jgi:hypothetical protein